MIRVHGWQRGGAVGKRDLGVQSWVLVPMGRGPSGSGLTLLHSWSQLVETPRALVCAALPLLLSAHCPACSSLQLVCLWLYRWTPGTLSILTCTSVTLEQSRWLGIVWHAAGGLVNPKGYGFSTSGQPFGSKYLSWGRDKQVLLVGVSCVFFPLWYLVSCF